MKRPLSSPAIYFYILCLTAFTGAGAVCRAALPQTSVAAFETANRLYEQGAYKAAMDSYNDLVRSGHISGPILFNLGNACAKSGQVGLAIAAYRQALLITPRDPDIEANLRFLRNQVPGPTWRPSRGQIWLKKLSLNEWAMGAAAAFWLISACQTIRILRPRWKAALKSWLLAGVPVAVGLATLLALAFYQARSITTVVVTFPNAPVRFGPLEESGNAFTAADGAELRVLDRKDRWFQVASDSRRSGWIRQDQVALSPGP